MDNNVNISLNDDIIDTHFFENLTDDVVSDFCLQNNIDHFFIELEYLKVKQHYNDDRKFYNDICTVKELWKICQYYGIDKELKTAKCKKSDIIEAIILFEQLPENYEIVYQRNKMWACLKELLAEPKMSKYIIWI